MKSILNLKEQSDTRGASFTFFNILAFIRRNFSWIFNATLSNRSGNIAHLAEIHNSPVISCRDELRLFIPVTFDFLKTRWNFHLASEGGKNAYTQADSKEAEKKAKGKKRGSFSLGGWCLCVCVCACARTQNSDKEKSGSSITTGCVLIFSRFHRSSIIHRL